VRVVAGELGGRRLHAPRGGGIVRPTSDRVREALFSILGDVSGERVLDLFCGTGALGIEALSRGADHATLVDRSIGAAVRNVVSLGIDSRCLLARGDALRFLAGDDAVYGLIFCDPPYRLARRLGPDLDKLLPARLDEGARVIVETAADEPVLLSVPMLDERTYGSTTIRIHGER
jgi:16S rRNA (guanine966-N2)-methyltransferase